MKILQVAFLLLFNKSISWNSAEKICQEDHMQLLTIDSDIEARFIKNILSRDPNLYYSPVIFLNMKQYNKVCNI